MPVRLLGARQLHARLDAVGDSPAEISRGWAEEALEELRARTPVRTGATRDSLRLREATREGASIEGSRVIFYLSEGTRAHEIVPRGQSVLKWQRGALPTFRPRARAPRMSGTHYRAQAAEHAWPASRPAERVVDAWNGAA